MSRPTVDHSLLSPDGHVSKAARRAAIDRTAEALFPPGYWEQVKADSRPKQPTKKEYYLRLAADLRAKADAGMKPRAYRKQAEQLEALAATLD